MVPAQLAAARARPLGAIVDGARVPAPDLPRVLLEPRRGHVPLAGRRAARRTDLHDATGVRRRSSSRGSPGLRNGGFFSQYTLGWPLVLVAVDAVFGSPELALPVGHRPRRPRHLRVHPRAHRRPPRARLGDADGRVADRRDPERRVPRYLFSLGLGLFFGAALLAGLRRRLAVAAARVGRAPRVGPADPPVRRRAVGCATLRVRRARVLAEVATAPARDPRGPRSACLPFVAFTLLVQPARHRQLHAVPDHRQGPARHVRVRAAAAHARHRDLRLHDRSRRSGASRHNLRSAPAVPRRRMARGGRGRGSGCGCAAATARRWRCSASRPRSRPATSSSGATSCRVGTRRCQVPCTTSRSTRRRASSRPPRSSRCGDAAGPQRSCCASRSAGATIPIAISKADLNHKISAAQEPWKNATRSIQGEALVIVENSGPYLMHLNPFSANAPDLDGRILFAVDRGAENLDLITRSPATRRRTSSARAIRGSTTRVVYHDAPVPTVSLIPLQVLHGNTATLRVRVTNRSDDPTVVAYLRVGDRVERQVLATDAKRGDTFETEWTVAPARLAAAAAARDAARGSARRDPCRGGLRRRPPTTRSPGKQTAKQFSYRRQRRHRNARRALPRPQVHRREAAGHARTQRSEPAAGPRRRRSRRISRCRAPLGVANARAPPARRPRATARRARRGS